MRLAQVLQIDHVVLGIEVARACELFDAIGRIVEQPRGPRQAPVARQLGRRHARRSTALGNGVTPAREGEALAGNRRIDLYLVDLGLPGDDGVALIRRLRGWTRRPVIVLSARSQEAQKVKALDAGADDYLGKPFGVAELHARLRVALRHAAQTALAGSPVLHLGDVEIDLTAKAVRRAGEPLRLTATQWRLLEVLARHAGRVVTARQLLREVWGPAHTEQGHCLRICVRQLRRRLEADPAHPRFLMNETGIGYRLLAVEVANGGGAVDPSPGRPLPDAHDHQG